MDVIREAAVAGQFYPGDPRELSTTVEQYLDEAGAKTEQQSQGHNTRPDLNKATSAQAGQSVQEGRSHG